MTFNLLLCLEAILLVLIFLYTNDPFMIMSDDPLELALRPPPDETLEQRNRRLAHEEEAKRISLAIDASIKAERQARRKKRIVRLLLLGQSESGKSLLSRHFLHPSVNTEPRQINHA